MAKKGVAGYIRKITLITLGKVVILLIMLAVIIPNSFVQVEATAPLPTYEIRIYPSSKNPLETHIMQATAYTHTGNPTKSGVYPTPNYTVAADPDVLPIGTAILINKQGPYIVEDTGCKNNVINSDGYYQHIQGNRIDIFMNTRAECIEFGRKEVEIVVIK